MTTEAKQDAPSRRPRTTQKVTGWRVQYHTPGGVVGPFHDDFGPEPIRLMTSKCLTEETHTPPETGCGCGLYAGDDVRSLVTVLHAAEFRRANGIRRRPELRAWSRVMVVRGVLGDALPVQRPGGGELLPAWSDGEMGRRHPPPGVEVVGFGVRGNPPGTWRGSTFTATELVIQAEPDDDLAEFSRDYEGLDHHFVTEQGVDSLLSSALRRFIASGRSGEKWWTS